MFDFEKNFVFSVDKMLAFLAKKLRILGFDTYLRQDSDDLSYFIQKSILQKRFIITSSYKLLSVILNTKRYKSYFNKIIFINNDTNTENIKNISYAVNLVVLIFSFLFRFYNLNENYYLNLANFINQNKLNRCLICNNKVIQKDKNLYYCINCSKFYWEGYHHKNINFFIKFVISELLKNI